MGGVSLKALLCELGKFILSTNSDAKSTFLDLKRVQVISGSL